VPAVRPAPTEPAYALSENETEPGLKRAAADVALALTTWEAGETVADIAARLPPEAGGIAGAFYQPGSWSRGRIVYPQLGGLLPDAASVMVVVEQTLGTAEGVNETVRTLDLRLRREAGEWRLEQLASTGGDEVFPPADLPALAEAVLGDPRIELPDSARWDIYAGRVSPRLLALMARLADETPYGVVTLFSGHPFEIFGTPRRSDHARGLAVDIYRIGDRRVVDDRLTGSTTHRLVAWLYDQPEIAKLGSPWAIDGFGGRSFTDALHNDHLHIAVYPDDPAGPADPAAPDAAVHDSARAASPCIACAERR
jgi:hypothetical protein